MTPTIQSANCGTCMYWGRTRNDGRFYKDAIKCRITVLAAKGLRICGRIHQTDLFAEGLEDYPGELVGLEVTGGNYAYLITRREFGCKYYGVGAKRPSSKSAIRPCKRFR